MPVLLPDELLTATRLTESELKTEIALALFQREHLTLGKAAIFCGLNRLEFQRLLASRQIPIHYGIEEWEEDWEQVKGLALVDRRL